MSIDNIKAILPVVADIEKLGSCAYPPDDYESSKTESYPMNPYFGSSTVPGS